MKLNAREKNLGVAVVAILVYLICRLSCARLDARVIELTERLSRVTEARHQAESLLKTGESAPVVHAVAGEGSKPTMTLLGDLTAIGGAENVRVLGVERSSPSSFKLTLEGRFADLMHFLSFLERNDGSFSVAGGEIERPESQSTAASEARPTMGGRAAQKEVRSIAAMIGPQLAGAEDPRPAVKCGADGKKIHAVFSVSLKGGA
jgi:hypothetical protein